MILGKMICLSPFGHRHLDATLAWVNDNEFSRLLNRAKPVSQFEHERWFEKLQQRSDCIYFAVETLSPVRHVGNVWLWDIDQRHRKAEIRVLIGERECLGRGIGSEAISLVTSYGFNDLHLHKVYAYVLAMNIPALRAFERLGFNIEGTLRKDRWVESYFSDVYLLGKLNEPL